ncbi:hypothetical protein BD809_10820 [Aquimarina intermedia]|uniref:Uncharacterized protein n=1 Tax=Aquimarina intermedia TaxID=350814 RepID=A0A5S5BZV6_9FLAO|nr:hypothetical protein BD809_10820 [Aquimarina intermedia]
MSFKNFSIKNEVKAVATGNWLKTKSCNVPKNIINTCVAQVS